MGKPGNGDRPDGDGPHGCPGEGLPDLPAEWGTIVIPDDAAELATEAAQVRRELRTRPRTAERGPTSADLPPLGGLLRHEPTSLRISLVIVSLAVLATLVSLIAVIWHDQQQPPNNNRAGDSATARTLPAINLIDADGTTVPIRGLLPAVLVLIEGCDCTARIQAAATNAPAQVTVIPITTGNPAAPTPAQVGTAAVRPLADPAGRLAAYVDELIPQPGTPTLILVATSGEIVRILPAVTPIENYRSELTRLPTR